MKHYWHLDLSKISSEQKYSWQAIWLNKQAKNCCTINLNQTDRAAHRAGACVRCDSVTTHPHQCGHTERESFHTLSKVNPTELTLTRFLNTHRKTDAHTVLSTNQTHTPVKHFSTVTTANYIFATQKPRANQPPPFVLQQPMRALNFTWAAFIIVPESLRVLLGSPNYCKDLWLPQRERRAIH